jgi:hypothetical protein
LKQTENKKEFHSSLSGHAQIGRECQSALIAAVPNYSLLKNKRFTSNYIGVKELVDNEPTREESGTRIVKIMNGYKDMDKFLLNESWNATVEEDYNKSTNNFSSLLNKFGHRDKKSVSSITDTAPRVSKVYRSHFKSVQSLNENNRDSLGIIKRRKADSKVLGDGTNNNLYNQWLSAIPGLNKVTEKDEVSKSTQDFEPPEVMKNFIFPKTRQINLCNTDQKNNVNTFSEIKKKGNLSNRPNNKYNKTSRFEYYKKPSIPKLYNHKLYNNVKVCSNFSNEEYLNMSKPCKLTKKWYS